MTKWRQLVQNMHDDMSEARAENPGAFTTHDDVVDEEIVKAWLPNFTTEIVDTWCSDPDLQDVDSELISRGYYTDYYDDDLSIVERMDICIKQGLHEEAERWIDDNTPEEG